MLTVVLTAVTGLAVLTTLLSRGESGIACPRGTALTGARPPAGREQWCEKLDQSGNRVRHGPYRAWYPDGRIKIEGQFVEGDRSGRWTFWHGNGLWDGKGQKKEEGEFRAGKEHGLWTRWYSLGPKRDEGEYRDGVKRGRWASWHELGQKEREGQYLDGQEVGVWRRWNQKGEACPPEDRGTPAPASGDQGGVVS